jgi:hypothetical protein
MRGASHTIGAYLTAALFAVALSACQGANPVKPALESGRPDVIAYAIEGSYTIVQGKALAIVQNPSTPQELKDAIASIDAKANPILDTMRPLAKEAEALRASIAAGGSGQERLATVLLDLDRLVNEVSPLVNELLAAIAKAGG